MWSGLLIHSAMLPKHWWFGISDLREILIGFMFYTIVIKYLDSLSTQTLLWGGGGSGGVAELFRPKMIEYPPRRV